VNWHNQKHAQAALSINANRVAGPAHPPNQDPVQLHANKA